MVLMEEHTPPPGASSEGEDKAAIEGISITFLTNKPIGASPRGSFVFFGGRGRFGKKGVMLRGLRISEKNEILHKLTIHTLVLYLFI
jgi:hypothetical protein